MNVFGMSSWYESIFYHYETFIYVADLDMHTYY